MVHLPAGRGPAARGAAAAGGAGEARACRRAGAPAAQALQAVPEGNFRSCLSCQPGLNAALAVGAWVARLFHCATSTDADCASAGAGTRHPSTETILTSNVHPGSVLLHCTLLPSLNPSTFLLTPLNACPPMLHNCPATPLVAQAVSLLPLLLLLPHPPNTCAPPFCWKCAARVRGAACMAAPRRPSACVLKTCSCRLSLFVCPSVVAAPCKPPPRWPVLLKHKRGVWTLQQARVCADAVMRHAVRQQTCASAHTALLRKGEACWGQA